MPNDHPVHTHGPGADHAAQARSTELETAVEPVGQLFLAVGVDQLPELGAGVGVGIVSQPRLGPGPQLRVHPPILPHPAHARIPQLMRQTRAPARVYRTSCQKVVGTGAGAGDVERLNPRGGPGCVRSGRRQ
jgi:hypothetical protein